MKKNLLIVFLLLCCGLGLFAQDTVKVMHYNILQYGNDCNVDIANKTTWLKNIMVHEKPDILTVNEIGKEEAYANRIKLQALTYAPMDYAPTNNTTNSFIINRQFYNTDKFEFVKLELIPGNLRDIDAVTLRDKRRAALGDTLELTCINMHLKAGSSSSDQSRRASAAASVMAWIDAQGPDFQNYLVMGDFNIGSAGEPAWRTFTFNTNTAINLQDPTGFRGGWGVSSPQILTQAPTPSRNDCGVGGSLDDRFDFILTSNAVQQHSGQIGYIPGSYEALGNDGRTPFNQEINCTGNTSVPSSICGNLKQVSDHLPIVLLLQFGYPTGISASEWRGTQLRLRNNGQGQNPVLEVSASEPYSLELTNMKGQQLFVQEVQNPSQASIELPLAGHARGVYYVRVFNKKGQQKAMKFSW